MLRHYSFASPFSFSFFFLSLNYFCCRMSHRIKISVSITVLHWTVASKMSCQTRGKTHCAHHVCRLQSALCAEKKNIAFSRPRTKCDSEHGTSPRWHAAIYYLFCCDTIFFLPFFRSAENQRVIFGIFSFVLCVVPSWPRIIVNIRSAQKEKFVERPPARWEFVAWKKMLKRLQ